MAKKLLALLTTGLVSIVSLAMPVAATSAGSISVSPAQLNFTLAHQTTQQSIPVAITNSYDAPIELSAEFRGINETAGLLIPSDSIDPSFGAALAVSQTDITLAAHSTQTISVQASNLASLSPGGHYATLVLSQQPAINQPSSLRAVLSLSIFVIKQDGERQNLSVTNFSDNGWLFHAPTNVTLNFKNAGNVHVVPRASVDITSSNDQTVFSEGIANAASIPLLPGVQLAATAPLQQTKHLWFPQRLTLNISYRPDGATLPQTLEHHFWYIPPAYLLLLLIPALLAGFRKYIFALVQQVRSKPMAKKPSIVAKSKTTISIIDHPKPPTSVVVTRRKSKKAVTTPKA